MKARSHYELPNDQKALLARAVRLQWLSIGALLSIIGLMALSMGSSQAMKTAWAEDTLSLVPPISFLIAVRVRSKPPDERYPYGRHRVMSIAFLVAATALAGFGALLLYKAVAALVRGEHPTIGFVTLFGTSVWMGYPMIATLAYSVVPPIILGHKKLGVARALHAKVLHADAQMNKADWMTGLAAIVGIVGIGFGFWWADSVAAGLISWSVLSDGVKAVKTVTEDLMDRAPRSVDAQEKFDVVERLETLLAATDWIDRYQIRLREEGDVCVGEVFVETHLTEQLASAIEETVRAARTRDFRLYDLVITPVRSIATESPGPRANEQQSTE